jgi:hypothetical protein
MELDPSDLDEDTLTYTGCDDAIVGISSGFDGTRVVYSYNRLVEHFMLEGMDSDEAIEWVDYNVVGAYGGPKSPIVVTQEETTESTEDMLTRFSRIQQLSHKIKSIPADSHNATNEAKIYAHEIDEIVEFLFQKFAL